MPAANSESKVMDFSTRVKNEGSDYLSTIAVKSNLLSYVQQIMLLQSCPSLIMLSHVFIPSEF